MAINRLPETSLPCPLTALQFCFQVASVLKQAIYRVAAAISTGLARLGLRCGFHRHLNRSDFGFLLRGNRL